MPSITPSLPRPSPDLLSSPPSPAHPILPRTAQYLNFTSFLCNPRSSHPSQSRFYCPVTRSAPLSPSLSLPAPSCLPFPSTKCGWSVLLITNECNFLLYDLKSDDFIIIFPTYISLSLGVSAFQNYLTPLPIHLFNRYPPLPFSSFFAFLLVFSPPAVLFRLLLVADLSSLPCTSPYLLYFSLLFSSAMHTTPVIFLTFSLVRCSRLDIPVTHLSILIQVHSIFLLFSRCPRLRPIYHCWSHYCLTRLRFRSAWHPLIGCH